MERISAELNDTGSFADDYYEHWGSLARVFQEVDYDEDNSLSQAQVGLMKKRFGILSKGEKSELLRSLRPNEAGK